MCQAAGLTHSMSDSLIEHADSPVTVALPTNLGELASELQLPRGEENCSVSKNRSFSSMKTKSNPSFLMAQRHELEVFSPS